MDRATLCKLAFPDGLDVSMLPRYGHLHAPRDEQQKLTIDAFALDVANYVIDQIMPHIAPQRSN